MANKIIIGLAFFTLFFSLSSSPINASSRVDIKQEFDTFMTRPL
ncbi:MAG: hypothetical protein ACD_48C00236G0001 [uncultured bacterium]|nr:MAG: hypothetical protein ACD_48C00236G0001 [uncultured bacterium]